MARSAWHTPLQAALVAWAAILGAMAISSRQIPEDGTRILKVEQSIYRTLYVTEEGPARLRCLTFGKSDGRQSCMDPSHPERLVFDYARATMGALYLKSEPRRILIVGLGGGTLPMAFQHAVPEAAIDVVEIDPAVIDAARGDFGYREGRRGTTLAQDARVFVRLQARRGATYDIVVLDAFDKTYIPEHLLSREFLEQVRDVLAPGGVVAANTFARSALREHEVATYQAVFGKLLEIPVEAGNRILLASSGPLPGRGAIEANAAMLEDTLVPLGTGKDFLLPRIHPLAPAGARVLTDQYSPSNLLQGR